MDDVAVGVVLEALPTGVLVVTPDWHIVYGNAAAARRLGFRLADFHGADLRSVCPSLAADRGGEGAPATLRDGIHRCFDADVRTDAATISVAVRVTRDAGGRLVFEVAPEDDRTTDPTPADDRREENAALRILARQMAALADSRQLLTVLCEAAWAQCGACGAAVVEVDGDAARIAAAVGALQGVEGRRFMLAGSLTGRAIESRGPVVTDDFGDSDSPLAAAMRQAEVGPALLEPLLAHDEVLGVLVVARQLGGSRFGQREMQRLQVIADHASLAIWKAQLLEQAQAADSAKGRFLATMSHELRTPLTALTGYGELLADQVIGPLSEPQLDILERMRSVTHHLATMIEEVLAYSSLETGAEIVRPTEFLAADLVQAVAAVVEPIATQKGIALSSVVPAHATRVIGDVDKMRQILVNLAGNAVKFTEHGSVELSVGGPGDELRFVVRDTGVGIAAVDMPRLFRPFTQLDTGLTRRHGGTGLGLYISQRLATILGGRIDVESRLGQGSTFTLVVPRVYQG